MIHVAALKPLRCRHPDCALPEGGNCARAVEFADPEQECPELFRADSVAMVVLSASPAVSPPSAELNSEDATPWRGRHLSPYETEAILRRSPARLISVLGPYNAGKTSLLVSFFLQIANGQYGAFPYRFASSRTLYGLQDLVARANRWTGKLGEQVVDHTPKEEAAQTGRFLHVGLRPRDHKDERHIDLLLSDVPGEWIEGWTRSADDQSHRRLPFIPRSDGFIVVADASELMAPGGARMDAIIGRLIRRIVASTASRRQRGIALVFSKFDKIVNHVAPPERSACSQRQAWGQLGKLTPAIWAALEHAAEAGVDTAPMAVSAFPKPLAEGQPAGVLAPFEYIMSLADRRDRWSWDRVPVSKTAKYFLAMRRREIEQ